MPTTLTIEGQPLAVFTFPWGDVESWNDLVYMHRMSYRRHAEEQKEMGQALALAFMNQLFKARRTQVYLVENMALIVIKIYLKSDGKVYDVTNPSFKSILDGFTDSRIWPDDEWAFVPLALFAWGGIDEESPRFEVEVHKLAGFVINGQAQRLPMGRERV